MRRLAVLGASGHGMVVADAALASARWDEVEFFDDRWPGLSAIGPWPVVGNTASLLESHAGYAGVIVGIGSNRTRLARHFALANAGAAMTSVIHPSAIVSPFATLGEGSMVCALAVLNPFGHAGVATILNTGATVDHECMLGDGVHISPGAHLGGTVSVGEASWIGIGASVRQGIVIGADVVVGAGASVVANIADGLTVAGVPARTLDHDART